MTQAMQPRQRSKCAVTVAFSAIVPSRRASMRWIRPRGESISSCQRTYVGHVGRQKPQWTQSDGELADHAARTPRGSKLAAGSRSMQALRAAAAFALVGVALRRVRDAGGGRTTASGSSARTRRELPGAKRTRPRAPACRPRDSSHTSASGLGASDERARGGELCLHCALASPRRARRRARDAGRRARSAGAASEGAARRPGGVVGLDHERSRGLRQRMQAEARARDEREASRASRRRAGRGRSPRRSSRPSRRRWRSSRPRARASRRGRDRAARRSDGGAGRRGSSASSAPTVGSPGGSSESRWPCRPERRVEDRQPQPRLDGAREVARLVLEDPVEAVGGQVVADPQAAALGVRRREEPRAASSRLETLGNADPLERWTRYGPGTSPQSRGVGMTLPGLQSPCGSNARAEPREGLRGRARRTSAASSTPCPCRRRARP